LYFKLWDPGGGHLFNQSPWGQGVFQRGEYY
jgi:hypothetical protein